MNSRLITFFLIILSYSVFGQNKIPQGYFIMPIAPGQISSLSGCFGDIRINHFHAGLDVRTGGVEGKPVYAAADGYISRIKIMNGGYGNALYVTHPNGYTTAYAHLKVFSEEIQAYLVSKQYEQKTWEIDLSLSPNELPVTQRQIIALSGNTGGSGGPHLHFEIRDQAENVLDPALFGFSEITDNISPIIEFISLKCMSKDASINGKFGIFNFPVIKSKTGLYTVPANISAKGKIGLEILTYDKTSGSPFRQGVNQINLNVNHENVYNFRLEKMAFYNKLDMNVHVNYEKLITKNQKIHKCYVEPGNTFDFYKTNEHGGAFDIVDGENLIEIRVNDVAANNTALIFNINKEADQDEKPAVGPLDYDLKVLDNFVYLKIQKAPEEIKNIIIVKENEELVLSPRANGDFVYDLSDGLPQNIKVGNAEIKLPINYRLTKNQATINMKYLSADFGNALYGDANVKIEADGSVLDLYEDIIPLKSPADITWQKSGSVDQKEKYKVYLEAGKPKFIGGEWDGNKIIFKAKEFGKYQTRYDFDAPYISARTVNKDMLSFRISDALSGIKEIKCHVNEEWTLMNYEYKSGLIWSEKLDKTKPFTGKVVLEVIDNCNNIQTFETNLPEL
jgi:murein DD-endopeptidase MepM/ murein hydrolase activator NlpD